LAFTLSHLFGTFNLVPAVTGATALTRLSGAGHFKLILIFVRGLLFWELDLNSPAQTKRASRHRWIYPRCRSLRPGPIRGMFPLPQRCQSKFKVRFRGCREPDSVDVRQCCT
jgi:hypothetical protein